MATHSSILAWRIPMDRGSWWAAVHRVAKKSDMTEMTEQAHTKKKKTPTNQRQEKKGEVVFLLLFLNQKVWPPWPTFLPS